VRSREIGGRTAARFTAPSPSGRFGFGFFSSMSETVSMLRGGAAFGGSADFAAGSGCAGDFALAGACVTAGLETFAGA
jgi:hypothetical protein